MFPYNWTPMISLNYGLSYALKRLFAAVVKPPPTSTTIFKKYFFNYGRTYFPSKRFFAANCQKSEISPPLRQEYAKQININAHINIISEIPLTVTACNILKDTAGRTLHTKLFSDPGKRKTMLKPKKLTKRQKALGCKVENDPVSQDLPCMQVCISDDMANVDIILNKQNCAENAHCVVEVPIFADLHVDSFDNVEVTRLNCKDVTIETKGNIHTKQIRCSKEIILHSKKGTIKCENVLMGNLIDVETKKDKEIALDVAIGGELRVKTTDGNISTNCVYSKHSLFETSNGYMRLKNVHKDTEVYISENGYLQMVGTRAQFNLCCGDAGVNLQLAYAIGNSRLTCNESTAKVFISDKISKSVDIMVNSKEIKLDNSLKNFNKYISPDKTKLEHKAKGPTTDKLTISSKGKVELCELMWIDHLISEIKQKQAKANQKK